MLNVFLYYMYYVVFFLLQKEYDEYQYAYSRDNPI